jgi:hypothetical protein
VNTRYSLRLVAQQVQSQNGRRYRLVAYATDYDFDRLEFDSLEKLKERVALAIPDFDWSNFSPTTMPGTQVILSSGLTLSARQVRDLGFRVVSR